MEAEPEMGIGMPDGSQENVLRDFYSGLFLDASGEGV